MEKPAKVHVSLLEVPVAKDEVEAQVKRRILVPTSIRLSNINASKKQACCGGSK